MKIQFKLRDSKSKNDTLIILVTYLKGKRLVYSTGESINPIFWDKEKQRAIIPRKEPKEIQDHCRDVNTIIERTKSQLIKSKTELTNLEIPVNVSNLRERLNKNLNRDTLGKTQFLKDYLDMFIKQLKNGERITDSGNKYAIGTITAYNSTLTHIQDFEKNKKMKLRFDKLSKDFYNKYLSYLSKENLEPNTIGKDIKNIKAICRNAEAEGITVNPQAYNFKTIKINKDAIYLNEIELEKIKLLDLSKNSKLDNARDLFLIVCWTGLRYSDLEGLNEDHFIKDKKFIRLNQYKTSNTIEIPVHYVVREILEKNNGLPRMISNVNLNLYVKDVCKLAGIKENVFVQSFENGLKIETKKPKHELVTVHTARRSFATNLYKSKQATVQEIMLFTGHKSESAFFRYIKVTKEEMAERLSNIDFFNSPLRIAE